MADDLKQTISCPKCNALYAWRPQYASKRVRCQKCGAFLQMPQNAFGKAVAVEAGPPAAPRGPAVAPGAPASHATSPLASGMHVVAAPSPSSAGGGSDFRFVDEADRGGICPSCSHPVRRDDVLCPRCGLNLQTGRASAPERTRASRPTEPDTPGMAWWDQDAARAKHAIKLSTIFKSGFGGDTAAEALILTFGWFGWSVLLGVVVGGCLMAALANSTIGVIATGVAAIVVLVAALGWVARTYVGVVEQYESGAMMADTHRSKLACLGVFIAVTAIAGLPVVPGVLLLGSAPALAPALLVLAGLWAYVYWPMGFAVAAAYGTLNPVRVLKKIAETLPGYLMVLLFLVPFMAVAGVAAEAAQIGLSRLLPSVWGAMVGRVLGVTIGYYGMVRAYAMLGMLLRRYKQPEKVTASEVLLALAWASISFAIFLAVLIVRFSSLWDLIDRTP